MSETAYPEPPRRTVLAVACPHCGAGQQEKCISRTGRQTYDAHSARFAMAKRAGVFDDPDAERMARTERADTEG